MDVRNLHSREIAAPVAEVGAILDSLGGDDDRLWPVRRWPALPFALDGPLAAGARGGHGPIRYAVAAYEPGRRVEFAFAPGLGLAGGHRFEVEPVKGGRSRLRHLLECRVEPRLLLAWPVILGFHNALLEDLLDQAERSATGRLASPPSRWPLWLRVVNEAELRAPGRIRVAA